MLSLLDFFYDSGVNKVKQRSSCSANVSHNTLYNTVMRTKVAAGIAQNVDHDQSAPK